MAALTVIGLACGDGEAPASTETGAAPQHSDYSNTDLKYRLIEHFGGVPVAEPVAFCWAVPSLEGPIARNSRTRESLVDPQDRAGRYAHTL